MSASFSYPDEDDVPLFERQPIVLHFGSRFCRLGFSGVHFPLKTVVAPLLDDNKPPEFPLLRSECANVAEEEEIKAAPNAGPAEGFVKKESRRFERSLWQELPTPAILSHRLGEWLQQILGGTFGVNTNSGDCVVVIAEGPLLQPEIKAAIIRLLMDHFQVFGVAIISDMVAPLYSCGVQTGLVIDIGFTSCRVQPTCFGSPLVCALRVSNGGAAAVLLQLRKEMLETADSVELRRKIKALTLLELEDIAVKVLYVQYRIEDEEGKESFSFKSPEDILYRLQDGTPLVISSETRWRCAEALFDGLPPSEAACDIGEGVVSLILNSLKATPRDARRLVVQNVLLCGGFACLRGFTTRLAVELNAALAEDCKLSALSKSVFFGVPPAAPSIRQWVGASLHSMLQGKQVYTRVDWQEGRPLPDWSSVAIEETFLSNGAEGEANTSSDPLPPEALKEETRSLMESNLGIQSKDFEAPPLATSPQQTTPPLEASDTNSKQVEATSASTEPAQAAPVRKAIPVVPKLNLSAATRGVLPKPKPPMPPPLLRKTAETSAENDASSAITTETACKRREEEETPP